ncbi:proline-rich protein 35 [Alligator mississippiensis]|uniref:Proline-rich protein 35 n=1 Tax=Alligator mississippiensis TaxID=8496 RepID=A0A151N7C0_ALLMI|nr:proline-rich protein 35 [Alligator mississippiensis]KYO32415.1 proline-rich protein 35 [Alligator mississippiensis]
MSKDEVSCKLTSVYKHKERKPKKPHYIPRPWGKPYNYKCFQCPFTCMEKSHLYNHMKYSLCKNSLSLLIESDWPYKKGNLLHPELRLLQATETSRLRGRRDEQEACDSSAAAGVMANPKQAADGDDEGDKPAPEAEVLPSEGINEEASHFQEEEEDMTGLLRELDSAEKKEKAKEEAGDPSEPEVNTLVFGFKNKRDKPCKEVEPDFIITDVFSLKNHMMKGKETPSPDLEAKPKHCKVPKKCLGSSGILMEQWKLVANGQRRGTNDVSPPRTEGNIIPCYPPPAYGDYHEPHGLNLSLLGINYPLNPSLFSYLGPTMTNSATAHPHLTQLPFLASTAQLMHPHSTHFQPLQHPERSAFLPRFYYPLLFEHTFSSTESKTAAGKPEAQQPAGSAMPAPPQPQTASEPQKAGLLKVPVLKTNFPWAKGVREEEEEKWLPQEKESNPALGINSLRKKPAPDVYQNLVGIKDGVFLPNSIRKAELPVVTCLENAGAPVSSLKRKFIGSGLDFMPPDTLIPGKLGYHSSTLRMTPAQLPKSLDRWHMEFHTCPTEEQVKTSGPEVVSPAITPSDHTPCKQSKVQETSASTTDPEATTLLIGDLSKTLEEYQEVEKKLSDLAKEDTPGQKHLREQLVKIRRELYHIHQALEKATKPHEGPLDLSVKRSSEGLEKGHQAKKDAYNLSIGGEKLQSKDQGAINKCVAAGEPGDGDGMPSCLLEAENKTIDLLIKMSRSENLRASSTEAHLGAVIKAEVLPLNVPLELRHVMEPYYSRTTKCEADSSVLLCSDGRSSTTQGPQLPVTEDGPLSCRAMQRSLSCGLPNDTDAVCIHSPLNPDP